jgi:hypothetical protein
MISNIYSCLTRFEDADSDHRYMAVSDLLAEVEKPAWRRHVSADEVDKVCKYVLDRLDDTSGDISALAVKWYARRFRD